MIAYGQYLPIAKGGNQPVAAIQCLRILGIQMG